MTAEHLKCAEHVGNECSKMNEGIARMRFIHLNKVDHQRDVATELLVIQEDIQGDRGRRGEEQTGLQKSLLACNYYVVYYHQPRE